MLLDTHIWWWYLTGSERLSRRLRTLLDASAGECWLSPVTLWEAGMLVERRRIHIPQPFGAWAHKALTAFPTNEAPLTHEVALVSARVTLPHRDPADRFLAATALVYDLDLVTVDARLTDAEGIPTRSR